MFTLQTGGKKKVTSAVDTSFLRDQLAWACSGDSKPPLPTPIQGKHKKLQAYNFLGIIAKLYFLFLGNLGNENMKCPFIFSSQRSWGWVLARLSRRLEDEQNANLSNKTAYQKWE